MTKSLRALIVEDSEDDSLLLVRELRRGQYDTVFERIETAESMKAALTRQKWDIVISDYVLPRFSGLDALQILKQSGQDLPFIVVSGKIGEDTAVEAMKAGAHDYIIKGNMARLVPAVDRELREAGVRRERRLAEEKLKHYHEELETKVKERTAELEESKTELEEYLVGLKRAEADALRAKEDWERTFDSVPDFIAILDCDHRIVRVNRSMAQQLGRIPEECVGLFCYQAVHGCQAPPAFCPHDLTLRDGLEHTTELHEEGLGGDLLVTTTPLLDQEGRMIGSVHVARDITATKQAEQQLKDLNATLEQRVAERSAELVRRAAQLQRLSHELSNAEERERRRLAELLHDDLQQVLSLISLRLSRIWERCLKDPHTPPPLPDIEGLTALTKECIEKARNLSSELYPPTLHQIGLVPTLNYLARDVKAKYGLEVTVSAGPEAEPKDAALRAPLYRSISELLFNVHKHAKVSVASIEACQGDGELKFSVRDSGRGFDPSELRTGFGLLAIQERINCLGGRVEIESRPGSGTCISLIVPASTGSD